MDIENAEEFYFVRHGQTDANVQRDYNAPEPIPLNETGRAQARAIHPHIRSLPIQTICHSPFPRAVETKEIITAGLGLPEIAIPELGECRGILWLEMIAWERQQHTPLPEEVRLFVEQVRRGLIQALAHKGPVLIVAHGGVHWAICHLLLCDSLGRRTDNCVPLHFQKQESRWTARNLLA